MPDVPEDDPEAALRRLDRVAVSRHAVPFDVERKIALLRHYPSQMPLLFGDDARMCRALREHTYDGQPVERYWRARPGKSRTGGRNGGGSARR